MKTEEITKANVERILRKKRICEIRLEAVSLLEEEFLLSVDHEVEGMLVGLSAILMAKYDAVSMEPHPKAVAYHNLYRLRQKKQEIESHNSRMNDYHKAFALAEDQTKKLNKEYQDLKDGIDKLR